LIIFYQQTMDAEFVISLADLRFVRRKNVNEHIQAFFVSEKRRCIGHFPYRIQELGIIEGKDSCVHQIDLSS